MTIKSVYLIGSLRNPKIPQISQRIRELAGVEVFDDWFAAGPIADDSWQEYETARGHDYKAALKGYAADHVYSFDLRHLNRVDAAVLALPAGKSGHLELGYMAGMGKPTFVLFDKVPERWDVMYKFANGVFFDIKELCEDLYRRANAGVSRLQLPRVFQGGQEVPF